MASYAKYTRASTGHLCAHFERATGEDGQPVRYTPHAGIDPERSGMNYNLAPERQGGGVEFVRQRTSEVKCLKRRDVNVMCSWVVTLPKDAPEHSEGEFFRAAYGFLQEKYGEANVVSAHVHMDEAQPHMHFAFVPVVRDRKKGHEKVSAKECVERQDLRDFHVELDKALEERTGCRFRVHTGVTEEQGGSMTIDDLKKETARLWLEVDEAEQAKDELKIDIANLESQKSRVGREASEAVLRLKETREEIDSGKGKVDALQGEIKRLGGEAKELVAEANEAMARLEKKAAANYGTENVRMEIAKLREEKSLQGELANSRKDFESFRKFVEKHAPGLFSLWLKLKIELEPKPTDGRARER